MPEIIFKGKEYVYNHHLTVPYRPLVVDAAKGIGPADLASNLVIHGDNLHALKSLLPRYAGQVDLVFIDPPYNTGNESWCYSDNVNSPIMKEWLSTNPVDGEDMLRHDKWLCMMWPRLVLLRELLSERGSIWITLDDNEVHHARDVLDEIFGADNFVACCVWQKKYTVSADHTGIAPMHDYILVYQKAEFQRGKLERTEDADRQYKHRDEDGVFRLSDYTCNKTADERPNLYYPIVNPNTGVEALPSKSRVWAYSRDETLKHLSAGLLWWGANGQATIPYFKRYRHALKDGGKLVPGTWWPFEFADHTDAAKKELLQVLPDIEGLDNSITPKPTKLIERVLEIGAQSDSLVLDSFAGSGTTAHAVLKANAKDGGNRKFILVEGEDYADRLTAERVRRAIKGYAWVGAQRETLLEEKINFTQFKKADEWLAKVQAIRVREGFVEESAQMELGALAPSAKSAKKVKKRFDKINVELKDGVLRVEGEKRISQMVDGLGSEFTYCTLGEPLDIEKLLSGEALPAFDALGAWLFHTATGGTLLPKPKSAPPWYLGEAKDAHVWLVYEPDLMFLKSPEAALTLSKAKAFADWGRARNQGAGDGKRHLVFAPAKYLSNKQLLEHGVDFAPLPFALYREG
jgi:adenine-specific DNA-methyltransferase